MIYLVNRILFAVQEVAAAAVVLLPVYFLLHKLWFRNLRKSMLFCLFSLYLAAVYVLVGLPNVTYVRLDLNLNLVPVHGMIDDWKNSILNVILFVPLGAGLPVLWEKYRAGGRTLLFGLGISLTIELLQIFTLRATDINDLLTNTLGTLLGFACAKGLMKRFPAVGDAGPETKNGEVCLVFGITFAVMFFAHPFLSCIM